MDVGLEHFNDPEGFYALPDGYARALILAYRELRSEARNPKAPPTYAEIANEQIKRSHQTKAFKKQGASQAAIDWFNSSGS